MTNPARTADALHQLPAPFLTTVMQIEPQWIDFNGHLNMAYYNVLFDRGIDQMWAKMGIGPSYMAERGGSTFTAECHVRYLREVHLGDPVQVAVFILDHDEKRIHTFEELRHATDGWGLGYIRKYVAACRYGDPEDGAVSTRHCKQHRRGP